MAKGEGMCATMIKTEFAQECVEVFYYDGGSTRYKFFASKSIVTLYKGDRVE